MSDESLGSSMNLRGVGLGNPLLSPHLQMTYSEVAEVGCTWRIPRGSGMSAGRSWPR